MSKVKQEISKEKLEIFKTIQQSINDISENQSPSSSMLYGFNGVMQEMSNKEYSVKEIEKDIESFIGDEINYYMENHISQDGDIVSKGFTLLRQVVHQEIHWAFKISLINKLIRQGADINFYKDSNSSILFDSLLFHSESEIWITLLKKQAKFKDGEFSKFSSDEIQKMIVQFKEYGGKIIDRTLIDNSTPFPTDISKIVLDYCLCDGGYFMNLVPECMKSDFYNVPSSGTPTLSDGVSYLINLIPERIENYLQDVFLTGIPSYISKCEIC